VFIADDVKIDSRRLESGEWVKPGEDWRDLEIQTRGHTDKFVNSHQKRLRQAAKSLNGNIEALPIEIKRAALLEALIEHCLLGVRGLGTRDPDGSVRTVTFPEFVDMLRSGDYPKLVTAAILASAQVGEKRSDDVEDAIKNLLAPSGKTSNGDDSGT
jgi:hypothetical protein